MRLLSKHLLLLLLALLAIEFVKCAPTKSDETKLAEDPCRTEGLLNCKPEDQECHTKNIERIRKRQAICEANLKCTYCNGTMLVLDEKDLPIPIDIDGYDDENLVVPPEIVPTLFPPIVFDDSEIIPINETIIIDADVSTVTERQHSNRKPREFEKIVERNIVIENDNETQYYRGYVDPSSNITTIIRLTNLINNTNVINMPTTLNNTNINNIHVYSNKSSKSDGKFGLGFTEDGPCCWSMKPGACKTTTAGLKCGHKKEKVCGKQCNRKMIHPGRVMCNNIPQWPYIICPPPQNQGFMPSPYYPPFNPSYPSFDDEFDDDDDLPLFPEDEELENPESGWVVMQEKCKIVSEDGLQITNCSDSNTDFEHPFARNSIDDQHKRTARHTGKHPQTMQVPMQQLPYGYPMMQPIYLQPIPMYIPQYFMPPQNNYPQQLPFPPLDSEQYYSEPAIESKSSNQYRKSRKHAKKHPIVVEHDEEL